MNEPFMEHPSGHFDTAEAAMTDAISRLRELPHWNAWITFCAQGMGSRVDSYHFAEIAIRDDELRIEQVLDVDGIVQHAEAGQNSLLKHGQTYSIKGATPHEAARILDTIFREHMVIKPHTGEGSDYAVGAEWESPGPPLTAQTPSPPKRPWWRFW